jgi:hypothetical protein
METRDRIPSSSSPRGATVRATAVLFAIAVLSFAVASRAENGTRHSSSEKNGMAELGAGVLGLPGARVCGKGQTLNCDQGDMTPMVQMWQLLRASRTIAAGAGISLGMSPSDTNTTGDPSGVEREHGRGYLTAEGILRYYLVINEPWETWVSATSGLAVVSDTYRSRRGVSDQALVGPRGVTLRTEGFTLGVGAGLGYLIAENWSLGATLRTGLWILPSKRVVDPFGDEASLRGANSFLMVAVSIGYRTRL